MIKILCDQYRLYPDTDFDSTVSDPSQYEAMLSKIEDHSKKGASFRVVVRNPVVYKWLDAAIKFGAKKRIIMPAQELARHLGCQVVPDWLLKHQNWIGELNLIEKSVKDPVSGGSVEIWLKQTLLGDAWTKKEPRLADELSDIVNLLGSCEENSVHPLKKYIIDESLKVWSQAQFEFSELFQWVKDNPYQRSKYLVWEQLLSKFPEDKISVWMQQNDIWYELSLFSNRHKLPILNASINVPDYIITFATSFLDQEWENSPEGALSFISGFFDFEKNFLLQKLRQ